MGNPFDHFGLFLFAVYDHLFTLLAGCVVLVILNYIERHTRLKGKITWKHDLFIVVIFLFFACFQAWHDEYKRAESAMRPMLQPSVTVNVPAAPAPQVVVEPATAPPVLSKIPAPSITYEARKMLGVISQVQVFVTAKGDINHPAFRVTCDQPCGFSNGQYLGGATKFEPTDLTPSKTIQGWFIIPAVMKMESRRS